MTGVGEDEIALCLDGGAQAGDEFIHAPEAVDPAMDEGEDELDLSAGKDIDNGVRLKVVE